MCAPEWMNRRRHKWYRNKTDRRLKIQSLVVEKRVWPINTNFRFRIQYRQTTEFAIYISFPGGVRLSQQQLCFSNVFRLRMHAYTSKKIRKCTTSSKVGNDLDRDCNTNHRLRHSPWIFIFDILDLGDFVVYSFAPVLAIRRQRSASNCRRLL